jgi:hypothetical protein
MVFKGGKGLQKFSVVLKYSLENMAIKYFSHTVKVSVVRQSHSDTTGSDSDESSSRGIFGRKKKKSKKEDSQTALVFSFSNADFSKNYNDFLQEAATTTNQKVFILYFII